MTAVRGTRLTGRDRDALVAGVEDVLSPLLDRLGTDDRVVLLPDVHYPYHPSTGMVTDPDVVAALAATLAARLPSTDVHVAVGDRSAADAERTMEYLGYDDLDVPAGVDVTVLDASSSGVPGPADATTGSERDATSTAVADGAGVGGAGNGGAGDGSAGSGGPTAAEAGPETPRTDGTGDRPEIPALLADSAVVPVPSARVGSAVPIVGNLALLARAIGADPTEAVEVRRAVDRVGPAGAFVDATTAFAGDPHRARTLLCGDDVGAVDGVLAGLLGVDPDDVPGLDAASGTADASVDGLDAAALAAELPGGDLPEATGPHPVMRAGYRLYTRISGDVYPPQLQGDR